MKVGILGTGMVGQALGTGFVAHGHDVMMGSRDAGNEKLAEWVAKMGERASGGTFSAAAAFGEVVVLATLWSGTEHAIQLAEPRALAGKVVIDTTNPLVFSGDGPPSLALGYTDSAGEQVQRWLPDARVVKAFNIVGAGHMVNPSFPDGPPDMFIRGNDADAKETVTGVLQTFGWSTIDVGDIKGARLLEPLALLWIDYGFRTGGWDHAFKLLRK